MDAAQIAGLNCLRLMNDTTAGEILIMHLVHSNMKRPSMFMPDISRHILTFMSCQTCISSVEHKEKDMLNICVWIVLPKHEK